MFATTILTPGSLRSAGLLAHGLRSFLMAAGLLSLIWFAALQAGWVVFPESRKPSPIEIGGQGLNVELVSTPLAEAFPEPGSVPPQLSQRMQRALHFVARRYSVSNEALLPIFLAVEQTAREHRLDPLLIVAVIGIESRFNPFSQSVVGAQGLMQVMPVIHADKLPENAGELPLFDPVTNVQVGARVLKESIVRNGGIVEGLQQFAGAASDAERRYASKVLGEHQRLLAAVQAGRGKA